MENEKTIQSLLGIICFIIIPWVILIASFIVMIYFGIKYSVALFEFKNGRLLFTIMWTIFLLFIFIMVYGTKKDLKKDRKITNIQISNKKHELKLSWISKQLKVIWFWDCWGWWCVKAKAGDKIYRSDVHDQWDIISISMKDLKDIYKTYWFTFNENETYKSLVLKEIDRRIEKLQYEIANSSLWKNFWSVNKTFLNIYKNDRKAVEQWYNKPEYWEVNWHRVTVWDTVDVYFDPNNSKNYRVDIDFLFEK